MRSGVIDQRSTDVKWFEFSRTHSKLERKKVWGIIAAERGEG